MACMVLPRQLIAFNCMQLVLAWVCIAKRTTQGADQTTLAFNSIFLARVCVAKGTTQGADKTARCLHVL